MATISEIQDYINRKLPMVPRTGLSLQQHGLGQPDVKELPINSCLEMHRRTPCNLSPVAAFARPIKGFTWTAIVVFGQPYRGHRDILIEYFNSSREWMFTEVLNESLKLKDTQLPMFAEVAEFTKVPRATTAAEERYEVLKAMNVLAKACNDESFYYNRWIEIIPDGASDAELQEVDKDTFEDAVRVFINHYHKSAQEGGLYVGGERWPD